jgi:hypothetical protein
MQGSIGVHTSHCCLQHGCKYGDDDCPVASGGHKQEYPCETCGMMERGHYEVSLDEEGLKILKQVVELTGEQFLEVQLQKSVEFHLEHLKNKQDRAVPLEQETLYVDVKQIAAGVLMLGVMGILEIGKEAVIDWTREHPRMRKFLRL